MGGERMRNEIASGDGGVNWLRTQQQGRSECSKGSDTMGFSKKVASAIPC